MLQAGGALGFAHIGVLKELERLHIPVDYIAGTSMGSIIAGLYASGMSPEDIETAITTIDWWDVMKDKTARRELDYRRKLEAQRYLFDLELGLRGYRLVAPNGMASGQKLNNILQTLTLNAASVAKFDDLNIPYRAVATDLNTGEAVILDHGNLGVAMRASMAVPGAFTPVELDGRTLVDGGIVKNVPVDVVKNMGADILIVVDVGLAGAQALGKKKLESLSEILGQTYELFRLEQRAALTNAAVLLTPDTSAFSAGDFQLGAALVKSGEADAKAREADLKKFSVSDKEFAAFLEKQRRRRTEQVTVKSIDVVGARDVDERVIRARIESKPGSAFDPETVNEDVSHIHGMGDFQTVTYRLKLEDDGAALQYLATEKPWGPMYVHMGLRLQSDFDEESTWAVLLNLDRKCLNDLGGELSIDLKGGNQKQAHAEWYQPLSYSGLFFIAPTVNFEDNEQGLYDGSEKFATYEIKTSQAGLDLGMQVGRYGEVRVGGIGGQQSADRKEGSPDVPVADDTVNGATASIAVDRRDRAIFARTGYLLRIEGLHATEDLGSDVDYDKAALRASFLHSIKEHTLVAGVDGGTSFGSDLPIYDQFRLGGINSIAGLNTDQLRGNYAVAVHLGYRYRFARMSPSLGDGIYLLSQVDAGNAWLNADDVSANDMDVGVSAGLGADTVMGPFAAGVAKATGGQNMIFMALGTIF